MKNSIPKSYLEVNRHDFKIYFESDILKTDALIIDHEDIKTIFLNFDKYKDIFEVIRNNNIQIFVKMDTKNLINSYKDIKNIDASYITGFALPHASIKLLNTMDVKARDFEHSNKLNFGTLSFIPYIDSPEAVVNLRKIASYARVCALYIDEIRYLEYLGLNDASKNYLREQVFVYGALAKKPLIDSYFKYNELLLGDMSIGKELGTSAKLTKDLTQLDVINEFYTPSAEEVEEARTIYNALLNTKKKDRKKIKLNDLEVSEYRIIKSQIILSRSNDLQDELNIVVSNEKIKDGSKVLRPKKFYTFGEEIANAITHGLGVALSILFLVMLLIKGRSEGFITNFAYVVYALSAFTLYLSSTLYHGLPLASRAKNLFHKFDRMSIYLLIAGTYTPLTLITIGGNIGLTLFIVLWVSSLIGIILNFLKFGKFKFLHMFLYVFLGWIAVFYIKTIFDAIGEVPSLLILLGGISYTVGIIFYSLKLFKFTHMIWHFFTIIGTILHFVAIYLA